MIRINTRKITFIIVILVTSSCFLYIQENKVNSIDPFFTLVLKQYPVDPYLDYAFLIKQHLSRIGINIYIVIQDWAAFLDTILVYNDFDIILIGLNCDSLRNYFNDIYNENGSLNVWGYDRTMDWDESLGTGKNEWLMEEIDTYTPPNSQERYELCWEWQNYLMDEILLFLPLFTHEKKMYYYNNLEGFDYQDGLLQSWGNLDCKGLHQGQVNQDEVVFAGSPGDLSPFFYAGSPRETEEFIIDCIMDSLFWRDSDHTYWPHIVKDWEYLADNHLRLTLREDIKWQNDPENTFTNEYLDVDDVYFTLYCIKEISIKGTYWYWLEDYYKVDKYTIDLIIGNENYFSNNGLYNDYFDDLSEMNIVPEHYFNQTQLADGRTPDITHPSWITLNYNPFGTGLFEIKENKPLEEIVLTLNPNSWWVNSSITNDERLNWQSRFGDFIDSPNQLRIRFGMYEPYTRLFEFYKGKLDLYDESNFPPSLDWLETNNIKIQSKPTVFFNYIGFNMRPVSAYIGNTDPCQEFPEISKGLAIRKAIAYAINREEINDIIHGGELSMNNHPISPILGKWCNPNIVNYCHNLEYAKYFMLAAGFDRGGGWIDYPPGFPDWENACPSTELPTTVSINFYYYFGIFGVIGLIIIKRRKKI